MDIRIKIGREVEGSHTFRVPSKYDKVSRHHATLYWHNGMATIEDNGSTNGTYVNGSSITKTQIHENDVIWLGGFGAGCYQLDLKRVLDSCGCTERPHRDNYEQRDYAPKQRNPEVDSNQRTNYSSEFVRIKQAYKDYHKELSELKKKSTMRMQLPRVLLSMIPAVLGLVILLVSKDMTIRIVAMSAGSVLSGLIGTLTMGRSSSKQEQMAEDILDLQLKYQKKYKCPKCGKQYSLDLHWKKLQADGCPFGCGARFV